MTERVLVPDLRDEPSPGERSVSGPRGHHLARVTRVRVGDRVVLFDGRGRECDGTVTAVAGDHVSLATSDLRQGVTHDRADVTLLQGIPKGERLETIVRQATELGVRAIWPVFTARSVPQPRGAREGERTQRLGRIAEEAARQCARADVPEVCAARSLEQALDGLVRHPSVLRLVAWEQATVPLGRVVTERYAPGPCALLVGPEGGLDAGEVERAARYGFVAVSLGPRILRTETVAPALLGALAVLRGDIALR